MQSPRQNIERWNKAGFKALQILFFCYQSCFPARTHRSGVFCILTVTANTCKYTDKQHMLSRRSHMSLWDTYMSLSLSLCLSLYICLHKWEDGVEMFSQSSHPPFFPFCEAFLLLLILFFVSVAKYAEAVCSLSHFGRKMTLILD